MAKNSKRLKKRLKIGILGGSFNPPHMSHVLGALYVILTGQVDRVWFLPCFKHPFSKSLLDFEKRVALCKAATKPFQSKIKVSAIEKALGGISYTIDTVKCLLKKYPQYDFYWIVGEDTKKEMNKWKDSKTLLDLISIIIIPRKYYSVDFYLPDISSTEIRKRITQGKSIKGLVPTSIEKMSLDYYGKKN